MNHEISLLEIVNDYYLKFKFLFRNVPINQDLLKFCVESISRNDKAHNLEHVFAVCKLAVDICEQEKMSGREKELVVLGALFHDLGCCYERSQHHVIGYGLTYEYLNRFCPFDYTSEEVMIVANAVLEHRSSNKNKPTNKVSEIVSIADSGRPKIKLYIQRCIQFREHRGDLDRLSTLEFFEEVKGHLVEKFGPDGYHWKSYPDLGLTYFDKEWKEFSSYLCKEREAEFDLLVKEVFDSLRE